MFKRLVRTICDAAFPRRCNECHQLYRPDPSHRSALASGQLETAFADWVGEYFCKACIRIAWVRSPLCPQCGIPYISTQGVDHLCNNCEETSRSFDEARAAGIYQHCLRTLVQDFKYRGCEYLAGPLGRLLWSALVKTWHPDDFDWIVPVPLHWRKLIRRGFNQAEVLMRCWPQAADESGIVFDSRKITNRMLIRHRHTASQTGLGRRQRKANMRQAFRLQDAEAVCKRHILIVDDVFTTGATVDACSRILKRDGAASVKILTLARAA